MSKEITMPQLSQTTDEVKLIKWLVEFGQDIKRGQALCEVETDKTTMELESFENGSVLKLLAEPGQTISAGQVIAILGEKNEKVSGNIISYGNSNADMQKPDEPPKWISKNQKEGKGLLAETGPAKQSAFMDEGYRASAIVKNIAKIKNINLNLIKGTGPQGIITKEDLEKVLKTGQQKVFPDEIILSKNQLAVARNLAASKSQIPHYYVKSIISADPVLKWRENNLFSGDAVLGGSQGKTNRVSMYAIFVFAAAASLKKFPRLNGYFKENKIVLIKDINIGFAVAEGEELYAPVVKNAGSKSIFEIENEIKILIAKTRLQKFDEGDLSNGTFTISNLGAYDAEEFCAIINPPQAGILAVGKIRKALYVDEIEKISIRNEFTVTGSFDHRIVNGKSGAEFLYEFKKTIEEKII
jgi:pyruvate dehydrogenase E2 component (dihydrolipoamide acetyltransferase)